MTESQQTFTVDTGTVAKNPGRLSIEPFRWLRHRPLWPIIWTSLFLISLWLTLTIHWSFGILTTLFLAMNWLYWRRLKDQFLVGCANPAKIININPMRIAVYTDLRCGYSAPKCPTIKIIETKLPNPKSGTNKIGDEILTVSLYSGRMGKDRWLSFDPIPARQVSKNQTKIDFLKSELEDEWELLDRWLSKVPDPTKKGLYAFDQGNDIPRGETQDPPEKRKSPWDQN